MKIVLTVQDSRYRSSHEISLLPDDYIGVHVSRYVNVQRRAENLVLGDSVGDPVNGFFIIVQITRQVTTGL